MLTCAYALLRKPRDLTYAHFMHAFFCFFDQYMDLPPSFIPETCNIATLLELPLSAGFSTVPENRWILTKRPRVLLLKHFFTTDMHRRCFRPLHSEDRPQFPKLSSKLRRDLLSNVLVMTPCLLEAILAILPASLEPIDYTPFYNSIASSPFWFDTSNRGFKSSLSSSLLHTHDRRISSDSWVSF